MGRTDVLSYVFGYLFLLLFVWGYSIGYYYSDLQFSLRESEFGIGGPVISAGMDPLAWRGTDLLRKGQKFYYYVEVPKESISLSYEVVKEMKAGFLVKGSARSYSLNKDKGIIPTVLELMREENFFVLKDTGAPKTITYASSFWNTGLCHPLKTYFSNGPLLIGSSWAAPLPDSAKANVTVIAKKERLDSECFTCTIDGESVKNELTICKNIPIPADYQGEWCHGDNMKMVLEEYVG